MKNHRRSTYMEDEGVFTGEPSTIVYEVWRDGGQHVAERVGIYWTQDAAHFVIKALERENSTRYYVHRQEVYG